MLLQAIWIWSVVTPIVAAVLLSVSLAVPRWRRDFNKRPVTNIVACMVMGAIWPVTMSFFLFGVTRAVMGRAA